ncbi:MAG: hypothetical protein Q8R28_22370 [Dehalococcoidia bacterium]|nr:hypothetical protein [Dehalococcoidia bacterium]
MTEKERTLVLDKIMALKKQVEEVRNLNDLPSVDQSLRMIDMYLFLSTQHLGFTGAVFPSEDAWV